MLITPKIDKLDFVINKKDVLGRYLKELMDYLEYRDDVKYNKSRNYITVHLNPTKLKRPNLNYDDSMRHNLQMNTDLILDFFKELEQFSIYPHHLNIKELHIAKDRIMEEVPHMYNKPLVDNQTQYKGRVWAYQVNNGTTPSVHICNKSDSMKRGVWFGKLYNKGEQLKDHLKVTEIIPLEPLSKEVIKLLGKGYSKYTGRINLDKVNLLRNEFELKGDYLLSLPHVGKRLRVMDIVTMITNNTLYDELNKVFAKLLKKTLFPNKKEPTKNSPLDSFIVSGSMSRFDRLFRALDKYSNYKEYTDSVITKDDMMLNEIYDKFI